MQQIKTLRERLADPHSYDKPLFPRAIEEMSQEEQVAEGRECAQALGINVWQSSAQIEAVNTRLLALAQAIKLIPEDAYARLIAAQAEQEMQERERAYLADMTFERAALIVDTAAGLLDKNTDHITAALILQRVAKWLRGQAEKAESGVSHASN
jgi:hypothetical protein